MPDAAWKAAERRICQAFGGARRGPDGKGQSDCVSTHEAIQIKYSKRGVPEGRWIESARRHGRNEKRPWLLIVIQPGQHVESAVCVCSASYLLHLRYLAGLERTQIK
jgi:hypothetical protein